jgi:hypothetical protein
MTKSEMITALDEVIKDLEKPSTLRAPDGVFQHMLGVIKSIRATFDEKEAPVIDKKGKSAISGT